MRVAAVIHPYEPDQQIAPFRDPRVEIFRSTDVERGDLPGAVITFGGDGSVHRVLGALAHTDCPLLVVPIGSGNDFAAEIGIHSPEDALRAWKKFLDTGSNLRRVDLGAVRPIAPEPEIPDEETPPQTFTFADEEGRFARPERKLNKAIMRAQLRHALDEHLAKEIYFACIAGVGLDAETNEIASRMPRWLRRRGGYPLAALQALAKHRPQHVTITAGNESDETYRAVKLAMFAAMGNCSTYGNGMRMLPKADIDDGLLDLCFVKTLSKLKVLRFFHTVFSGTHLKVAEVEYLQAQWFRVDGAMPMQIYADGEYVCMTPAEVRVVRRSLSVIVP